MAQTLDDCNPKVNDEKWMKKSMEEILFISVPTKNC